MSAEDVIGGHPVAEAVRAAGVERDVAADRADRLARRIRRVIETVLRRGGRHIEIDHARLDDGDPRLGIDPEDAIQPVQRDDDAVLDRHGATREAGAAAARHEGHAGVVTAPHGLDDLVRRFDEHHRARPRAKRRQAVRFVRRERAGVGEQPVGREDAGEPIEQSVRASME